MKNIANMLYTATLKVPFLKCQKLQLDASAETIRLSSDQQILCEFPAKAFIVPRVVSRNHYRQFSITFSTQSYLDASVEKRLKMNTPVYDVELEKLDRQVEHLFVQNTEDELTTPQKFANTFFEELLKIRLILHQQKDSIMVSAAPKLQLASPLDPAERITLTTLGGMLIVWKGSDITQDFRWQQLELSASTGVQLKASSQGDELCVRFGDCKALEQLSGTEPCGDPKILEVYFRLSLADRLAQRSSSLSSGVALGDRFAARKKELRKPSLPAVPKSNGASMNAFYEKLSDALLQILRYASDDTQSLNALKDASRRLTI